MALTISDGTTTVTLAQVDGYEGRSDPRTIVHPAVTGDTSYTLRPSTPESGTLTCVVDGDEDAADLYALARGDKVLTLATDRAGIGMDFVVVGSEIGRRLDDTREVWIITIPFQELP